MKPRRKAIIFLLLSLVIGITAVVAGVSYYRSQCHGIDDCAAAAAESHERDRLNEPR